VRRRTRALGSCGYLLKRPIGRVGEHGWTAWEGHPSRRYHAALRQQACAGRLHNHAESRDDFMVLLRLRLVLPFGETSRWSSPPLHIGVMVCGRAGSKARTAGTWD